MKIHYDKQVDALYIQLGSQKPDGVVELAEGVNLDTRRRIKLWVLKF